MECTSTHQRLLEIRQTNDRQTWCVNLGREKNGRYVYVHLPNFEGHVASVPSSPRHPQVLLTSWYTEMDWSDLVGNSHWTSENGYRNQANTIVTIHCFSRKLFFYLCGGCYGSFSTTRGFRHRSSACKYFWEVPLKKIGRFLILFQGSYYPSYTLKITTTHILGFPANHHRFSNVPRIVILTCPKIPNLRWVHDFLASQFPILYWFNSYHFPDLCWISRWTSLWSRRDVGLSTFSWSMHVHTINDGWILLIPLQESMFYVSFGIFK